MEILPAIDLRDGKVVRLLRGDYDQQTEYSDDPVSVARSFVLAGARWIHVVDLDAARSGKLANTAAVQAIRRAVPAKIQLGGGARDEAAIRAMLAAGADRVVVGSAALRDWEWFSRAAHLPELTGRIALGLDARQGRLAVKGWTDQTDASAPEVAGRTKGWPLAAIVYTDIARDGTLEGVNVEATAAVIEATDVPVIASGGVGALEDVRRCRAAGCAGVIIGRAYYEGRIDLAEALRLAAHTGDK